MHSNYKYLTFCNLTDLAFWDYYTLSHQNLVSSSYPIVELKQVLIHRKQFITINNEEYYKRCRVQVQGKGVVLRDIVLGREIKTKKQQVCKVDDFLVAEIDAKVGGFGIVPKELEGAVVSGHYFLFDIDTKLLLPEYLGLLVKTDGFLKQVKSTGSTNYSAIRPYHVMGYKIPLPTISEQKRIIEIYNKKLSDAHKNNEKIKVFEDEIEKSISEFIGIVLGDNPKLVRGLLSVEYSSISEWGIDKILNNKAFQIGNHPLVSIEEKPELAIEVFRGKSPKYTDDSDKFILNQKCNRWNEIDLSFVKTVDAIWFKSIDKSFFTQEGDILINSTGEGTIGRASVVPENKIGLLYDSHILLLRLNKNLIDPEYFVEVFNSKYGQDQVDSIKSAQATKQTELGIGNLKRIRIPLPEGTALQRELVEGIKAKRNMIKTLLNTSNTLRLSALEEFEQTIFVSHENQRTAH